MAEKRLFCIPYAGGSSMVYLKWKKRLDDHIDLYPVELSGRSRRFCEPLYESFDEAVKDIYESIKDKIDEMPYSVYGHSMGSWLAFELYYYIKKMNGKTPEHIFFSGRKAPDTDSYKETVIHNLPDEEFKNEMLKFGGTPRELFEDKNSVEIFIQIMRSDLKILEGYIFKKKEYGIESDVTVLCGKDEGIKARELMEWQKFSSGKFNVSMINGGHFFINEYPEEVARIINNTI